MAEAAEGGGTIAWRLLATLEGGSLLLAASALLAYTARGRTQRTRLIQRPCATVALTNTTSELGRTLKNRLEAHGCLVSAVTSDATSGAASGAGSDQYDALIVVGSQHKADGLNGIADLVTEDVYDNIKLLESLSSRVSRGGCIAWACVGAGNSRGAFADTANAFDAVLQASLIHVANVVKCVPVWVGRCDDAERAADTLVAALVTQDAHHDAGFSIRNAAHTVGEYLYRWLKIIT